ncbi:glutathione S-transferase [Colletotrichum asianum]
MQAAPMPPSRPGDSQLGGSSAFLEAVQLLHPEAMSRCVNSYRALLSADLNHHLIPIDAHKLPRVLVRSTRIGRPDDHFFARLEARSGHKRVIDFNLALGLVVRRRCHNLRGFISGYCLDLGRRLLRSRYLLLEPCNPGDNLGELLSRDVLLGKRAGNASQPVNQPNSLDICQTRDVRLENPVATVGQQRRLEELHVTAHLVDCIRLVALHGLSRQRRTDVAAAVLEPRRVAQHR